MNTTKFTLCQGHFEITSLELKKLHIGREEIIKIIDLATAKAFSDDYSRIEEFYTEKEALAELKKHMSDIRESQLTHGRGYTGDVWAVVEEEFTDDGECEDFGSWWYADFDLPEKEEDGEDCDEL